MKKWYLLGSICLSLCLASCDSGDIYPDDQKGSRSITATFTFDDVSTIPQVRERKLAFLSYARKLDKQPNGIRVITQAEIGKPLEVKLEHLPEQIEKVVLAIVDQDKQIIYSFWDKTITSKETQIQLPDQKISLLSYDRLQNQLFNQSCLECHSGGNLSGGLNLGEGQSFHSIVNVPSKVPGMMIVTPGDPENSLMVKQLTDYDTGGMHTTLSTLKDNDIDLLKAWILHGAKK